MNVGCIPSKSLLNNSHLYHQIMHDSKNRGIEVGDVKLNLENMMKAKDTSVTGLTKGIEFLFKKNKVTWAKGEGTLVSAGEGKNRVDVRGPDGTVTTYAPRNVIIATGSVSSELPFFRFDEERILSRPASEVIAAVQAGTLLPTQVLLGVGRSGQ